MRENRRKEFVRAVKFALFSASAGLIEMGGFALLNEVTPWSYWPCYLIALVLSVLWNFTLNREFTFHSAANVPIAMLKVALYYAVFTPLSTNFSTSASLSSAKASTRRRNDRKTVVPSGLRAGGKRET